MFKKICWRILVVLFLILGQFTNTESVSALGTPEIVSINPGSPAAIGTNVSIRATVMWDSDFRSMRICFGDTNWCQEDGTPDITKNFDTSGLSPGQYRIIAQVAKVDEGWETATSTETWYELYSNLTENPVPPQNPSISCSADSFDAWPRIAVVGETVQISGSGSCNVGVRAIKVKVDGNDLYEIGAPSLSWTWNTSGFPAGNHNLSLWVAGQGDNNWDYAANSGNIIISVLTPNQPAEQPSFPFENGNIIDINGNLFVVIVKNGSMERRHIPNPETLDALGIPRAWVDNKGWSNNDLKSIHQGSDIPDVNRDYNGFIDFKNRYFPNTDPIGSDQQNSSDPNQQGSTIIEPPTTGGQVQIIPNGPQGLASDGECPASPTVLTVNGQAEIANRDLNLRPRPNVNTDPLTIIPNFAQVKIVDGPRCKQEVRWYMVEYKGVQGWAAEVGTGGEYHMYPVVVVQPVATEVPQAEIPLVITVPTVPEPATSGVSPLVDTGCDELATGQWWNPFNPPDVSAAVQCTKYVASVNDEIVKCWGNTGPNAGLWDDKAKEYADKCGWSVTNDFSKAQPGDVVVWNGYDQNNGKSCAGAYDVGHVALYEASNADGTIQVNGSNWSADESKTKVDRNCMSIIHTSAIAADTVAPSGQPQIETPAPTPQVDKCSQYSWPKSWFCKWGWIK